MDIQQPAVSEFAPYYLTYVNATARSLASSGLTVQSLLAAQPDQLDKLVEGADPSVASYSYAPGKWTLGESIVHISDTERVFAYRLLRFARGDSTSLPGFDQDAWVPMSGAANRSLSSLLAEFRAVRASSVALIESLAEETLVRSGTASNNPVTVRALVWIIAGHAAHHMNIAAERYLGRDVGH